MKKRTNVKIISAAFDASATRIKTHGHSPFSVLPISFSFKLSEVLERFESFPNISQATIWKLRKTKKKQQHEKIRSIKKLNQSRLPGNSLKLKKHKKYWKLTMYLWIKKLSLGNMTWLQTWLQTGFRRFERKWGRRWVIVCLYFLPSNHESPSHYNNKN